MKWMVALILSLFVGVKQVDVVPTLVPVPTSTTYLTLDPSPNLGEGNQKESVLLSVPFTSQAPNGEWSDTRHQDGCEEASAIMAECSMSNVKCPISNGILDKGYVRKEMINVWEWEVENYGEARDTSAADTAERILGGYFNNYQFQISNIKYYGEIIDELARGNVVIVPVDGRGLNPNYTAPGPERHMILIRGYDDTTGEFITNDPGTRKGENYRYKYEKLFDSIRDYPTGDHVPITERKKVMIALGK